MDIVRDKDGRLLSITFDPQEHPELFDLELQDLIGVEDLSGQRLRLIEEVIQ